MQDKIQEIMGLVDALSVECIALGIGQMASSTEDKATLGDDVKKARALLESKLRELVREPLTHELAWAIAVVSDSALDAIRKAERAHGITKTSD